MTLLWLITFLLVQKLDRTRLLSVDIYSTYLSNSGLWSLKMKQQNCWAHLLQIHGFFMQILNGHVLLTSARVPSQVSIFTIQCMKRPNLCLFVCWSNLQVLSGSISFLSALHFWLFTNADYQIKPEAREYSPGAIKWSIHWVKEALWAWVYDNQSLQPWALMKYSSRDEAITSIPSSHLYLSLLLRLLFIHK